MKSLLDSYLEECAKITNDRGYTGLEQDLPRIKENLAIIYKDGKILEFYINETLNYCTNLRNKGLRIFGWNDIDEEKLKKRLETSF